MHLHTVLQQYFGYDTFRPGQEAVIRNVIQHKSQIAILPTGSGKSLCYQLPAYMMEGTVLIISPLVALMEDQVAQLKKQGEKRVAALNSFNTYEERQRILHNLSHYKFVFVSPEILTVHYVYHAILRLQLAFVVVDEAHCISQWGFDFRPDYLRLQQFFEQFSQTTVLALTATADQKVMDDITTYLKMDDPHIEKTSLDRPNISYAIEKMGDEVEKLTWLQHRLQQTAGPGIIYVGSRKKADELAQLLKEDVNGISAYHAGMEQEDRTMIQAQFINGELEWICATNAFGMGIHKEDVRQVIHLHIPTTFANYVQEVGRAGRDGKQSAATLLYTEDDLQRARFMLYEDFPTEQLLRTVYGHLAAHMPLEQIIEQLMLSETMERIIRYDVETYHEKEAIHQLQMQIKHKELQFQQMIQFIQETDCLRTRLLQYFGETLQKRPSNCCTSCKTNDIQFLRDEKNNRKQLKWSNWEERLSQLLG